jgi:chromosome segregation ATPase
MLGPSVARIEAATRKVDELLKERDKFASENASLRSQLSKVNTEIGELRSELASTKTKLREQNDADLMLVSVRIIAATLKDQKPEKSDVAAQQDLLNQQRSLWVAQGNPYNQLGFAGGQRPFGSIFGGL